MADLNIKKKSNKKPLLWTVLALLAVVAIILVLIGNNEDETYVETEEEVVTEPGTWGDDAGTGEANQAIDQYVTYTSDLGEIDVDHETSHRGITLLADALATLTNDAQDDVEELRQQADQLLENPNTDEHAGIVHDAFVTASRIIEENVATTDALKEEANQVTNAAQAVDGDVLLTDQKDAVKNFFDTAANTLNNLE